MAAAFNAPLGGAMFAIELLMRELGMIDIVPIILAAATGTASLYHY